MSDRPWLEDGDPALRTERELLKRLNSRQPPIGSAEQGWAALAADIGGLGLGPVQPTHGTAHAAAGSAGVGIAAKVALSFAVAGGMFWGGSRLLTNDGAGAGPSLRPAISAPLQAPAEPHRAEPPQLEVPDPPVVDALPPTSAARPAASATTLAEEGRLLAKAHQLVQAGQASQALEVLRKSGSLYPRSALYQEREVLTIEALSATGATGAARQRAERFLKRYPGSPHADRLQRFVE